MEKSNTTFFLPLQPVVFNPLYQPQWLLMCTIPNIEITGWRLCETQSNCAIFHGWHDGLRCVVLFLCITIK